MITEGSTVDPGLSPPIFLIDGDDWLHAFDSAADLLGWLEPLHAEEIAIGFDASGMALRIETDRRTAWLSADGQVNQEAVLDRVRQHFERHKQGAQPPARTNNWRTYCQHLRASV